MVRQSDDKNKNKDNQKEKEKDRDYSNSSQYIVESIIDKKVLDGKPFYLVKWVGYSNQDNTWEPVEHLENIQHHLETFDSSNLKGKKIKKPLKINYMTKDAKKIISEEKKRIKLLGKKKDKEKDKEKQKNSKARNDMISQSRSSQEETKNQTWTRSRLYKNMTYENSPEESKVQEEKKIVNEVSKSKSESMSRLSEQDEEQQVPVVPTISTVPVIQPVPVVPTAQSKSLSYLKYNSVQDFLIENFDDEKFNNFILTDRQIQQNAKLSTLPTFSKDLKNLTKQSSTSPLPSISTLSTLIHQSKSKLKTGRITKIQKVLFQVTIQDQERKTHEKELVSIQDIQEKDSGAMLMLAKRLFNLQEG